MDATGIQDHPQMKLGLRPQVPAKPSLKLARYLTPAFPPAVNYGAGVEFGLYGNDRYGVCGPASVANNRRMITAKLTGTMHAPSQEDVFDLYRRSGNQHFDPQTGADDNGVNMQTMLQAVNQTGIGGVKCLGFANVDPSNIDEMKAAIAIFGGVLFGVNLQAAQQAQTSQHVWDYLRSKQWGGHAVGAFAYQAAPEGIDVITWAQLVRMTDAFVRHQLMEAWVVIWPEHLTDDGFLNSMDLDVLAQDYEDMTGRKFPATLPPKPKPPVPPPGPGPAPTGSVAMVMTYDANGVPIQRYYPK